MTFIPANPLSVLFANRRGTPSAINEHMETLRTYGQSSEVVCELGVDYGNSTVAFLSGQPDEFFSFDRQFTEHIEDVIALSQWTNRCPNKIEAVIGRTFWVFHILDTSKEAVPSCDTLFIDTWHAYPQLKAELDLNAARVKKWIILHDTQSFGIKGESWQDWEILHNGEPLQGLWPAILEFLAADPRWYIKEHFAHNNGLTVLGRRL